MNFNYENQGTNTFLVYKIENDSIDSMSLGMITNNKIPGFAPAVFMQMDADRYIKYNVSAKITAKQFLEGVVTKKRIVGSFKGIVGALLASEDYMIDPRMLILDLNYIFADVSTCDVSLICLPIQREAKVDFGAFFKQIMFSTQFDQTENCDYVGKIINYLNGAPVFSLNEFQAVLNGIDNAEKKTNIERPATSATQKPQPTVPKATGIGVTPAKAEKKPEPPVYMDYPPRTSNIQNGAPSNGVQTPNQTSIPPTDIPPQPPKKKGFFSKLFGSDEKKQTEKKGKATKSNQTYAVPGATNGVGYDIPGVNNPYPIPGQPAPQVNQPTQQPQKPVQQPTVQPKQQPVKPTYTPPSQPAYTPPVQPQGQPASFGETTVLGGGGKIGETTVLGAGSSEVQVHPHLIRSKNNERINLDKPVFRIGKEKSYVDYFVSDNTAVSRSHCNIITRDGQYFIVDTNSTNHTYVNGGMIQSNVETPLSHGTKIRLANEDFEFRLY